MTDRPVILVALGCFNARHSVSGANNSLIETVFALSDRYRFRIIGLADDHEPTNVWHMFEGCERIALRRGASLPFHLARIVKETPHHLVLCNGFFDHTLTLPLLLLFRCGRLGSPILLTPHGEFGAAALALGKWRKRLYLTAFRATRMLRGVPLLATSSAEEEDFRSVLPDAKIIVGANIQRLLPAPPFRPRAPGTPLRIAFTSRIDRMKNLDWALNLLAGCDQSIDFDIYGPISDRDHWRECEQIIASMPAAVRVRYCGTVAREAVMELLAGYDLFLLPTRGENFGYAIADALLAGTPALIADTTPWRGLADARAGADLPLDRPSAWQAFLESFASLGPVEQRDWRTGARSFAENRINQWNGADRLVTSYETAMGHARTV